MFVLQPSLGTCESGACRGAVSFWVRSGTFFELFWGFHVRRVKKWDHVSGSVSGLAFRRFLVAGSEGRVFLSSGVFRDCFLVSLPVFSHVARAEKLRCPAHAAFRYDLLDSHQSLLCRSSMVPSLQPRVVLSVLQDARSCAEVAHAVLGMRSLKDGVTLWRPVRQVLPAVRCCGLLAVACKADSARYIFWFLPQVAAGHLQALLGLVLLVHSRAG